MYAVIVCARRWTITRCGLPSFTFRVPVVVTWLQLGMESEVSMYNAPLSTRTSQNIPGVHKAAMQEARWLMSAVRADCVVVTVNET